MPARKQKHKKKHHHQNQPQQQQLKQHEPLKSNASVNQIDGDENETATKLPYIIEESSIVGRYVVAARDLKAGEQLITEQPLAIGPCVSADPVCLGCYMPIELNHTQYRCPQCRWPLCGAQCPGIGKLNGHSVHECQLHCTEQSAMLLEKCVGGGSGGNKSSLVAIKNLYELILIIRILLMKVHEPEKYANILRMESHTEMRKENAELWQHYEQNVVKRLHNEFHMQNMFTECEIHTICGIVDVNCFEIGQNAAKARTLYPSAFLLAHDCCPNTSHTDVPGTYAIVVRTSRNVFAGEALTLSYAYTLQGTLKRRDFMHAGKLFWCQCARCADPYELGTDCSALICGKCSKGSIRSVDPLDQEAAWQCDSCDFQLLAKNTIKLLDKINYDLETIDVHDIPGLENFLKRYQTVLRPNHYLLLSAKYSLCQVYGRIDGYLLPEMSIEDIKRKEQYCRQFLAVIDKLEPQLTRLRGLIMYELHAPIMIRSQHSMMSNQMKKQEFQHNIKEVVQLLRESCTILKMEPVGSNEHQMGLAAEDALIKMGNN